MTQQTERDALRKLAEAATPGPWAFGTFHRLLVVQADKHGYADKHSAIADIGAGSIPWDETAESMQEYNDAEYIAAANPAAVITLLDQLQSQAERIKELEEAEEESSADAVIIQYHEAAIKRLKIENDTLRAQLADAELHTKQVERGLDKATAQLAEIEKTEPVLVVEKEPDYWSGGHFHEGSKSHIKPTKVWSLPVGTKLFTHPMPAKDVGASMINLPEPDDTYCGVNYYTESQLKQAVSDALDTQDVTELVGALQLFAYALPLDKSTIKTCYAVTDKMRDAAHAALSKYKGAK